MPTYGLAKEVDKNTFYEACKNSLLAPTLSEPIFMRLANKIYIAPSTVTAGTAYYYKSVTDLSDSTPSTESEIPVEFQHLIIKRVEADVLEALGRIEEKQLKLAQIQSEVTQAYEKFLSKQKEAVNRIKQTDGAKLQ